MQKLSLLQGFTLPLPEDATGGATHLQESYLGIQVQPDDDI